MISNSVAALLLVAVLYLIGTERLILAGLSVKRMIVMAVVLCVWALWFRP